MSKLEDFVVQVGTEDIIFIDGENRVIKVTVIDRREAGINLFHNFHIKLLQDAHFIYGLNKREILKSRMSLEPDEAFKMAQTLSKVALDLGLVVGTGARF
ncbi:hypothetical protein [Xanthomonas phage BUDD]|nr:hypothetical protein [Xanthomonas phage BUDD]